MRVNLKKYLVGVLILGGLCFALNAMAKLKPVVIRFGVQAFDRPSRTVLKYRPFLDFIGQELEKKIKRPVEIRMMVSRDVEENIMRISKGRVDFMLADPAVYADALKRNPLLKMMAVEKMANGARQEMVFAVKKESGFTSLGDLKGKKVAFGYKSSTCGRLIPQKELLWQGIKGSDLAGFDYVGRSENIRGDLLDDKYSAGVLPADLIKGDDRFVALAEFSCPTNVWVLGSEFPEGVGDSLKQIFFRAGPELGALKSMGATGFSSPSAENISEVEEAMVINWAGY